ncbi:hypothetical protein J1N35_037027 [Gossypium stocksii]|uniref:Uncharacterized protein n=1 Tax=Gossypium stocksii TaxID=47602 RepID=A0A9D3UJE5_9ROSI|nr:hypothetical protein J1N35_037027 [Gossypium stocksii]
MNRLQIWGKFWQIRDSDGDRDNPFGKTQIRHFHCQDFELVLFLGLLKEVERKPKGITKEIKVYLREDCYWPETKETREVGTEIGLSESFFEVRKMGRCESVLKNVWCNVTINNGAITRVSSKID